MHSVSQPVHPVQRRRDAGEAAATTTVAVAGATGYTGQELLRLLARHPSVRITAATSSGSTALPSSRGAAS